MVEALTDLRTVAPPDRRPSFDQQLELLCSAITEVVGDKEDISFALTPYRQGIGVRSDRGIALHGPPRQWSMRWWSGWNP